MTKLRLFINWVLLLMMIPICSVVSFFQTGIMILQDACEDKQAFKTGERWMWE